MLLADPVLTIIASLLTAIWAWWIARSIHSRARVESGENVVEYGPGIQALAAVGWIVAGGLVLLAWLEPVFPFWCRILLTVASPFIAICLHMELCHTQIRYDEFGVQARSPWRHDRLIPWEDIQKVTYSDWHDTYFIDTVTHGKLSLHRYMSGRESLFDKLAERNVPIEIGEP